MKHVFIIGSRGLPAQYGGFETFVEQLVSFRQSEQIRYHVACLSDEAHQTHFAYQGADCFTIKPPQLGPARVIAYDMMAISYALQLIARDGIENPIFYILGNTIGAFIRPFVKKIHAIGGRVFVNPDGLEWKRTKWSRPVRSYLKYSEKVMSRHADLLVADNQGIESYLHHQYPWSRTTFIAYGTDLTPTTLDSSSTSVRDFFEKWQSKEEEYYLILGRFVPENNYETAIREFMQSQTKRDLLIICNHEGNTYFEQLKVRTGFEQDPRVKFVGTVYNQELLKYIRAHAHAYIHGHEVGGTNPGLLEALAQTNLNLVLGVNFNRRVAQGTALYWSKEAGNLAQLIDQNDQENQGQEFGQAAKERMAAHYTWEKIVQEYEELFLDEDEHSHVHL